MKQHLRRSGRSQADCSTGKADATASLRAPVGSQRLRRRVRIDLQRALSQKRVLSCRALNCRGRKAETIVLNSFPHFEF